MSNTIPASAFVAVNPGVVSAGGAALALNGLFLTNGNRVPIGAVLSFGSAANVGTYFGLTSNEYIESQVYFAGATKATQSPGQLLFAQYPTAATPAWVRGGNVSTMTLTALAALSGTLMIDVNGTWETSSAIALTSHAGSFSAAAAYIQSEFSSFAGTVTFDTIAGAFLFTTTATGGSETITTPISGTATTTASTTTGTVLTVVSPTLTGTFHVGDIVTGTDGTNTLPAGTAILNQLTGTPGGAGTYTLSAAAAPSDLGACAVDAFGPLGAFVVGLGVTTATGAVTSQGAAAPTSVTPNAFMAGIIAATTAWVSFITIFDPDNGIGNTVKQEFAAWNTLQNNRYLYVPWDTDITPTESTDAASSLGQILIGNGNSGTAPIYEPTNLHQAAFICGAVASVDFSAINGTTSFAYLSQAGITPGVTNQTVMDNLIANGYNSYVAVANANNNWEYLYPGSVTGPFGTIENYINQIWLNSNLQTSLMTLLTTVKAVPYVAQGYALIEAACQGPINLALTFGAIQVGVNLSPLQIAEVNYQAGKAIAGTLQTQGYYLQVVDPGAVVRGSGGSPIINLWYTSGGSVLQINMSSIDVI